MPHITFVDAHGGERTVEARPGLSLMEVAVRNDVDGIDADCGGACACATCHVFIAPEWQDRLPPRKETETAMLDFAIEPNEDSRLSCQILLTDALDGMVVRIPASQS
jgi:2Fe-2S ferredoxin